VPERPAEPPRPDGGLQLRPGPGRFRGWLKTVTHHALCDFLSARLRDGAGGGDGQVESLLLCVEAREDLARRLAEEFDLELAEAAMRRVQRRVEPRTWEAFRLTALDGRPARKAAAELSMPVATVFEYKSRVTRMIQQEVQRLQGPEES
jgi:DNA-directed RNA polymerase specialized sigma24 family protein